MLIRDPVEEIKSTKVFSYLALQSSEYADRAIRFVEAIAPILATTVQHFPLYTRHDAHHGFQVVRRLQDVVQDGCFDSGSDKALGAPELFLLIAAAYAHDLGMTVFPGEAPELKLGGRIDADEVSVALGGAFLTTGAFNSFFPTMVQGRGWICIALVVFSSWRPGRALIGALLFAFFDAFQLRLQTIVDGVPYQLFLMAPYVLSIVALVLVARRARPRGQARQ